MSASDTLIDFAFGDAQLSGNRTLYLTLLARFHGEYQHAMTKLSSLVEAGDFDAGKHLVHTIKGVSGNLGLKALHSESKNLEDSLKRGQSSSAALRNFEVILKQTLHAIEQAQADAAASTTPAPHTPGAPHAEDTQSDATQDTDAKATLISRLNQNQFIPADELDAILATLPGSAQQKSEIHEAIDDLDYAQAIDLLNQLP